MKEAGKGKREIEREAERKSQLMSQRAGRWVENCKGDEKRGENKIKPKHKCKKGAWE